MNANYSMETFVVGSEGEKVIVIDNFMQDPEVLIQFACDHSNFYTDNKAGNYYPGLRLPPPQVYFDSVYRAMRPVLQSEYALDPHMSLVKAECSLSLVTLRAEELNDMQCLPHFDTADPYQFAFLHYLCDEPHGGTSFYRHNLTGYEKVIGNRFDIYTKSFMDDIELNGSPEKQYILDSNERYTKIGSVSAKFNRMVIYRSCLLHSADIKNDASINPDPKTGRLTANTFVAFSK